MSKIVGDPAFFTAHGPCVEGDRVLFLTVKDALHSLHGIKAA
ncbi:MAG TPA: hypothetical protein VGF02_05285 [Pseudolabrys sp.]